MIDLHCHILPGIDDGPPTLAASIALGRAAVAAGTTTIVATPHVSWEYPGNTAGRIAEGVAEVNEALRQEEVALEVLTGAKRFLLGSVPNRVSHHAPCSVLIIRTV